MPNPKSRGHSKVTSSTYDRPPSREGNDLRYPSSFVPTYSPAPPPHVPRRQPLPQQPTSDDLFAIYGDVIDFDTQTEDARFIEIDSQDGEQYEPYPGVPEVQEPATYDDDYMSYDRMGTSQKAVIVRQRQPHRPSPTPSDRSSVRSNKGNGPNKERKRKSDFGSQARDKENTSRHPSQHRLSQAQHGGASQQPEPPKKGRITDSLNYGHSSRPQALSTSTPSLGMVRQPPGPTKLRESTKFDTPNDSGKSPAHRPSGSVDRGSPKSSKRRHDGREFVSPQVPPKKARAPLPSAEPKARPTSSVDDLASATQQEGTKTSSVTHDLFAESEDDDDKLSSDDATLDELIGDQTVNNVHAGGKLKLNMPKSLDQVIKKVIGPMIQKVVRDRGEVAKKVCDEWEWERLEVLSSELNTTLDEARQKILGNQRERQGAFEKAKNDRIDYENKTTGIYKEHGKDYRVLCNDLTGNNHRAVKKIKREIKNEPRCNTPAGH